MRLLRWLVMNALILIGIGGGLNLSVTSFLIGAFDSSQPKILIGTVVFPLLASVGLITYWAGSERGARWQFAISGLGLLAVVGWFVFSETTFFSLGYAGLDPSTNAQIAARELAGLISGPLLLVAALFLSRPAARIAPAA